MEDLHLIEAWANPPTITTQKQGFDEKPQLDGFTCPRVLILINT
jgi:hypothetical protein